jgi:hypothetical protein
MARHALAEPSARLDPAGVAGLLCGAHAQILTAAEFSVGQRIAGATRADVRRALWEDRTLVKTFGPRGTVHLLAASGLGAEGLTVDELTGLTTAQRRELDDEAALLGTVMEATVTLTIGPVTIGPHA